MKGLIIIALFITIISSIILFVTQHFFPNSYLYHKTNDTILRESFSKNGKGRVCFDTCPDRNTIHTEIIILKDAIDALRINVNKLRDSQLINDADTNEKNEILDKSKLIAKREVIDSISKSASDMSGLPPDQIQKSIDDHLSNPVTRETLNNFKRNLKPMSDTQLEKYNRRQATLYDKQRTTGGNPEKNIIKTTNQFINSNRAGCNCSETINQEDPKLESNIINKANHYGFIQRWHGSRYCDATSNCARQYAKNKLKELCLHHKCTPHNPDGQYPYNLKQLNKLTKETRPTNYHFPEELYN